VLDSRPRASADPDPTGLPADEPGPVAGSQKSPGAERGQDTMPPEPPPGAGGGEGGETARCIRLARQGDRAAFADLVIRYEATVLRIARTLVGNRTDAEDVAQEVFLRLYRHLNRLDPERDPIGWVYRLTVHASWGYLKSRRREKRLQEGLRGAADPAETRAHDGVEAAEVRQILNRSLQILPPRVRAVFVLVEVEGLEVAEVAKVLRITRITVRRHLSRGREALRRHLRYWHPELIKP